MKETTKQLFLDLFHDAVHFVLWYVIFRFIAAILLAITGTSMFPIVVFCVIATQLVLWNNELTKDLESYEDDEIDTKMTAESSPDIDKR